MRGSDPERSSKCAATGPSRKKLLRLRPFSDVEGQALLGAGSPQAGASGVRQHADDPIMRRGAGWTAIWSGYFLEKNQFGG